MIEKKEQYKETIKHGTVMFPFQYYYQFISHVYLHWHNHFEIILIEKGHFTLHIDSESYDVVPGDILVITPGRVHYSKQILGNNILAHTFILDLEFLESYGLDVNEIKFISPLLKGDVHFPVKLPDNDVLYPTIKEILMDIAHDYTHKNMGYELMLKSHFYKLLAIYFQNFTQDIAKNKKQRIAIDKVKEVIRYVDMNINKPISVEDAANELGYSRSYFCRFFKTNTGQTFVEYINHRRISKAVTLLLESSKYITDIAYEVGYDDLSYFNKVFKKEKGLSPTKYRKLNQFKTSKDHS